MGVGGRERGVSVSGYGMVVVTVFGRTRSRMAVGRSWGCMSAHILHVFLRYHPLMSGDLFTP